MTFIEKIREITEKVEKSLKQEKKLINEMKYEIEKNSRKGCHSAITFFNNEEINNIDYVITYFKNEGFNVCVRNSYTLRGKRVLKCEW